jgi:exosortase/archaeosortase family protein
MHLLSKQVPLPTGLCSTDLTNVMISIKQIGHSYKETSDLNRFLIKGGTLFVAWRVFRKWLFLWGQYGDFTQIFSLAYLKVSSFFLSLFGIRYHVDLASRKLWVVGSPQAIEIVYDCLGTSLFATFLIFMLSYPGKLKTKMWFIPMGLLIIFLLNAARMAALTVVAYRWYRLLDLFHHFIFAGLIFLSIFVLWVVFVRSQGSITTKRIDNTKSAS